MFSLPGRLSHGRGSGRRALLPPICCLPSPFESANYNDLHYWETKVLLVPPQRLLSKGVFNDAFYKGCERVCCTDAKIRHALYFVTEDMERKANKHDHWRTETMLWGVLRSPSIMTSIADAACSECLSY